MAAGRVGTTAALTALLVAAVLNIALVLLRFLLHSDGRSPLHNRQHDRSASPQAGLRQQRRRHLQHLRGALRIAITVIEPRVPIQRADMSRYSLVIAPTASLVLASAFWGVATVISKEMLASVPPVTFLIVQLAPSVVLLWLIAFVRGVRRQQGHALLSLTLLSFLVLGSGQCRR